MRPRSWKGWLLVGALGLVALLCGSTFVLMLRGRSASALPVMGGMAEEEGMAKYAPAIEAAPPGAMPLDMSMEAPAALPTAGAARGAAAEDVTVSAAAPTRMVIKSADLAVVVDDPRAAQEQVVAWVEAHGGYVVTSSFSERTLPSGKRVLYGELQFRIPADRFLDAVAEVKSLAVRVEREDISGQDVTDEYVDLEARLRNLKAAEEELRRLLDQAVNTDEVLNIYRELMWVREEIERLEGRMRYLQESVAYSSVRVEFIPVEADEPVSIGGWEPQGVLRDALRALVRAGQNLVTALIWLGVYWLPVLLVVGLLLALAWRVARWAWRKFRGVASGPPAA